MYTDDKGKRHVNHYDKLVPGSYFFSPIGANPRWGSERPMTLEDLFDLLAAEFNLASSKPDDVVGFLVTRMLERRAQARAEKNWAEADKMRDLIRLTGIKVEDK